MIYFDNAATTKKKPKVVYDAVNEYLCEIGVSPGRGSYSIGIQASRLLYKTRCLVGNYFGLSVPEKVVFTKNSTEAINLFLYGFLEKGDHVIISCYEHNAVLRPIHSLKKDGIIDYSVISRNDLMLSPEEVYRKYAKPNTKAIVMTLASNLTGRIVYNAELFRVFRDKGITTFLDASQGAGVIDIDMGEGNIDCLAFTGHKDLLAIPGVGGLCFNKDIELKPIIQGGTGIHGDLYVNPSSFPERYEAGTLNMPAIWSLNASVNYLKAHKKEIIIKERQLIEYFLERIAEVENIIIYDYDFERVPVCSFNIAGMSSDSVVKLLDEKGICVRGGIHCAVLAHKSLGTVSTGAVRVSFGLFNSPEEIDKVISILKGSK